MCSRTPRQTAWRVIVVLISVLMGPFAAADDKNKEDKPKIYIATMETSLGVIELELNREKAKETVDNFLKYVRDGYYEDTVFHRVEKGYIVQGGGFRKDSKGRYVPKSTGDRKPIKTQAGNGLKNEKGTIAAARWADKKDSAKSEFYFNLAHNKHLDEPLPAGSGFTVFGKITKGMDVLEKMAAVEVRDNGVIHLPRDKDKKKEYDDYSVPFLPKVDLVIKKISVEPKPEG